MKKLLPLLIAVILTLCSACSDAALQNAGQEATDVVNNAKDADNKYVLMVMNGYRSDNSDLTYDKAFSAFFGTPRWTYFKGDDDQDVVEFTGDCTYKDVSVKARIQFIVNEEGGTFEATYLAFNDVPQDALTLAALIGKAFNVDHEESAVTADATNASNSYPGEVLYKGIPINQFLYNVADDIKNAFGTPSDEGVFASGYAIDYEGISFAFNYYNGQDVVLRIDVYDPSVLNVNGATLDKNREGLVAALGDPIFDDWVEDDIGEASYDMEYLQMDGPFPVLITILMSDPADKAYYIGIAPYEDGGGDEGWEEDRAFRRTDYFTGIGRTDLFRYPDNYYNSKVYLTQLKVTQVPESRLYIAHYGDSPTSSNVFVIDDRYSEYSTGVNAVVGDMITVYGRFLGNETLTWTTTQNGQQTSSDIQVPRISSDRLVVNSMKPDPSEFAEALVSYLNAHPNSNFTEHMYLYGSTVQLGLKLYEGGGAYSFGDKLPDFSAFTELIPDGYVIYERILSDPNGIAKNMSINDGQFYMVTCSVEYISGPFPKMKLIYESIESYK